MIRLILTFILITSISLSLSATHLRAGYIQVSGEYPTFTIKITVFLDGESTVPFGGGELLFGDGSEPVTLPDMSSTPRPDLGTNVYMSSYTIEHTYSDYGFYTINYTEPNRNANILNIPNSVNTKFSVETRINLRPNLNYINTPEPLIPLFFNMVYKRKNALALTCKSAEANNILLYGFTIPKMAPNTLIEDYKLPKHIKVNNISGLLEWDLTQTDDQFDFENYYDPYQGKEFIFAVVISQYTFIKESYFLTSSTTVDFQINVIHEEEEDGGIVIGGDSSMVLIEEQQAIEMQRTFSSSQKPMVDVYTNIYEGDLDTSVKYDSTESSYTTTVNLVITNTLNDVSFPRFIILRSKTTNSYFKDDVITVYFNDIKNPTDYITATVSPKIENINVYPNPSTGRLMITGSKGIPLVVMIYNSEGKVFHKETFFSETEIELTQTGIYYYHIYTDSRILSSGKLMINR